MDMFANTPVFDENGGIADVAYSSDDQRVNEETARRAIDALMDIPDEPTDGPVEHVLTARQKAILAKEMPAACYVMGNDGRIFIPSTAIDYAAERLFGDRLNSEIVKEEIVTQGKASVRFQGENSKPTEKPVLRVVATAIVRVTVMGPKGRSQSHSATGVCSRDVDWGSQDENFIYRFCLKGAVTDARRTALERFGRLFCVRGRDQDALYEIIRQRNNQPGVTQAPAKPRKKATAPVRPQARRAAQRTEQTAPKARRYALIGPDGAEYSTHDTEVALVEAYITLLETAENDRMLDAVKSYNATILEALALNASPTLRTALERARKAFDQQAMNLVGFAAPAPEAPAQEEPVPPIAEPEPVPDEQSATTADPAAEKPAEAAEAPEAEKPSVASDEAGQEPAPAPSPDQAEAAPQPGAIPELDIQLKGRIKPKNPERFGTMLIETLEKAPRSQIEAIMDRYVAQLKHLPPPLMFKAAEVKAKRMQEAA